MYLERTATAATAAPAAREAAIPGRGPREAFVRALDAVDYLSAAEKRESLAAYEAYRKHFRLFPR